MATAAADIFFWLFEIFVRNVKRSFLQYYFEKSDSSDLRVAVILLLHEISYILKGKKNTKEINVFNANIALENWKINNMCLANRRKSCEGCCLRYFCG
jgi:hypothetical protein